MILASSGGYIESITNIPVSSSWANVPLGVLDLSGATGYTFQFEVNGTSTNATNIELSYISLVPLPQSFTAQQFTQSNGTSWTSGSGSPSGPCTSGSLYTNIGGSTSSTLYVCIAGSWVGK